MENVKVNSDCKKELKRKSYLKGMQEELAIAIEHKLHPAIVAELEERIEAHKQYKRDYHKKHYVSKKKVK